MMTTTNTTVFKRMGRILSLVFSDYNEARAFREASGSTSYSTMSLMDVSLTAMLWRPSSVVCQCCPAS